MQYIVTGRVVGESNFIVGYIVWCYNGNNLIQRFVKRENLEYFCKENKLLNCKYNRKDGLLKSSIRIPISYFPKYNINGYKVGYNKYTDSGIIAITFDTDTEDIRILVCGALVSGGITDPFSEEAKVHADMYYDEIRGMRNDYKVIARRLGYDESVIYSIKHYLFLDYHNINGVFKRFDPSFEIAESWQRLMTDNSMILKHDRTLIEHEIFEKQLVKKGMSQSEAHIKASEKYNYPEECVEYYGNIKGNKKRK